jgi:VWFA-related protein
MSSTLAALLFLTVALAAEQPTFRSQVDIIRLDVIVVTEDGTPVTDLRPDDFEIEIAGRTRRVRTLQFLSRSDTKATTAAASATDGSRQPRTFWSNTDEREGRLFIIAVDTGRLPPSGEKALLESVGRFAGQIGPPDRVALLVLPHAGAKDRHVDFTSDGQAVQKVLSRVWADSSGIMPPLRLNQDTQEGFNATVEDRTSAADRSATEDLRPLMKASATANLPTPTWSASLDSYDLMGLPEALTRIDGPKTLILVTADLPPDYGEIRYFAEAAVKARLNIYALHPFAAPGAPAADRVDVTVSPIAATPGLDMLLGLTGGTRFNVVARGDNFLERIDRETSGSYVLGVDADSDMPPNKPLKVKVRVRRPGLTVRTSKQVLPPVRTRALVDQKTALGQALRQPKPITELPLRMTTLSARGDAPSKLTAVIVAESPELDRETAWGFELHDGKRVVADAFKRMRNELAAQAGSTPVIVTSVKTAPGSYSLRFGIVDAAGHRAVTEHPVVFGLHPAPPFLVSDVFVGERTNGRFRPHIAFPGAANLDAFVELYLDGTRDLKDTSVEFAVVGADGASRSATRVAAPALSHGKSTVNATLPVQHVNAGAYDVVARVIVGRHIVATVRQSFLIGPTAAASLTGSEER